MSEDFMDNSKRIAGLVGPGLIAMLVSEFPLVQPHLYDAQIPPVVYLSDTLMSIAGLAIVRAHNLWARNWTVLVTLSGWFFLLLGVFRMFAAGLYQRGSADTGLSVFMVLEGILLVPALIRRLSLSPNFLIAGQVSRGHGIGEVGCLRRR
jgi:hypothetical protein